MELVAVEEVKYQLIIEESIVKQKARIDWMRARDMNSHYIHMVMKARTNQNRIDMLVDEQEKQVSCPNEVEQVIRAFYLKLLGTTAGSLQHVDIIVMRLGPHLKAADYVGLCALVKPEEIEMVLKGIKDKKDPGLDGMNAFFSGKHGQQSVAISLRQLRISFALDTYLGL